MMRRGMVLLCELASGIFLLAGLAPVGAQGDFTPEEQAALDKARAVWEWFATLDTYQTDVMQQVDQTIAASYQGQTVEVDQQVDAEGTLAYRRETGETAPAQLLDLTSVVTQDMALNGTHSQSVVGPIGFGMIMVDGRIYLRMDMPAEMQATTPQGWIDVTGGGDQFPGMSMYNMDQLAALSNQYGLDYYRALMDAVTGVEILEPATADGETIERYRLTLDPVLAMDMIGAQTMAGMFNTSSIPLDAEGIIRLMYTDDDTVITFDMTLDAGDQTIHEVVFRAVIDIEVGPDLITDETLAGMTMTIAQDLVQQWTLRDFDAPVEIEAPDLTGEG